MVEVLILPSEREENRLERANSQHIPVVREVQHQASEAVDPPIMTHPTAQGYQANGRMGMSD
jgi:hypothetical protein